MMNRIETFAIATVSLVLALSGGLWPSPPSTARADDAAAPPKPADKFQPPEEHTFAGLVYIKQALVGTRSEGPEYHLQTYRADYLLECKKRHPWERDEALEPFARKFVAVRGTLNGQKLRVEQIQEIKAKRIPQPPFEALVEGNSEFAFELLRRLHAIAQKEKGTDSNLAVSPYSISTALGMTYAGARGATAAEMNRTLRWAHVEPETLHDAFGDLMAELAKNPRADDFTLRTTNRLWAEREFVPSILPEFREITAQRYGAEIAAVDFKGAADAARRTINGWVAEQTREKIKELIPPKGVDNLTRLVLTNAVHLVGKWESPFNSDATKPAPFFVSPEQKVEAPLMEQRLVTKYFEDDDLQMAALPIRGGHISMLFVLPREKNSLSDLYQRLSGRSFTQLVRRMEERQVAIAVPRFVTKASFELKPTLAAMGMSLLFSDGADLSGINGKKNLFVDKVFHEAFVDVNEAGVEAAAAAAVVIKLKSLPPKATLMRLDRPFLFALRDNRTGSILFLGQVVNPKQQTST